METRFLYVDRIKFHTKNTEEKEWKPVDAHYIHSKKGK